MHTMACFAATLGVIILSGFINLSAANKNTCELNAAVGDSLTLPFVYEGLSNSHVLRWTHNNKIIFYREKGRVSVGRPEDISATGSILLKNLQFSSSGTYQANVLHHNGTPTASWARRLCVMDKVSKPKVTYSCDFKTSAVNLNCNVAKPQGLVFAWTLDNKTLTSETRQTLSISLAHLKDERTFTCGVSNAISKGTSDAVHPTCKSPSPSPPTLLCIPPKTVAGAVAGGAGLILFLLIIIILCCCHRHSKTQMRPRDKRELRMLSVNKLEPDSISPDYETMHPTESSPPLSPEPSARACYETVSQPEAQTENRPPQLSTAAEGQQPLPVPKPRTRSPQMPNI